MVRSELVTVWLLVVALTGSAAACALRARRHRADRAAWILLAAGLGCWAGAEVVSALWVSRMRPEPAVSVADLLWLVQYPTAGLALVLMVRSRAGRMPVAFWIDGAMAAAAVTALAVLALAQVSSGADHLQVLVSAAHPAGDLLLVLLVVGACALGRTAWTPTWALLAAAFAAQVVSDAAYLRAVAGAGYEAGRLVEAGWYVAPLLIAAAAMRRPDPPQALRERRWSGLVAAGACGPVAIALLVWDHFDRMPLPGVLFAGLALVLVVVRLMLLLGENLRLLDRARREAETDALTGLGNRRALLEELEGQAATRTGALVLYDLDGFKYYNDAFGHPAGDELLRRLAVRLQATAEQAGGRAFRLGGDEFCLLAPCPADQATELAERGRHALMNAGEGFRIDASAGVCRLPVTGGATAALSEADAAMYRVKHRRRPSVVRQTAEVLGAAVRERHPDLHEHVGDVAALAARVARALGLDEEATERVRAGAELHDVGKIAIPDEVLAKPGPLDDAEWRFMRRHTIIGERILHAAPDLRAIAPLVRGSHERWDGLGYPDGLAGEAIPLGARIVAVCDAYDAMVSDRPYHTAISHDAAVAEVRRCAGTQFDARVVEAFAAVAAALPAAA